MMRDIALSGGHFLMWAACFVLAPLGVAVSPGALSSIALSSTPPAPAGPPGPPFSSRFFGVNLAGGEFGGKRVPGRYGYDYAYPDAATARPFLVARMNAVRVPVKWRRLQPAPFAPLDPMEMSRLDRSLAALKGFPLVILDLHDYGKFAGVRLSHPATSGPILADMWVKLATRYKTDPRIAFGLMNEPNGIDAASWAAIAAQSVRAIRGTGARNLILVPGTRWTGAHSWTAGGDASNGAAFAAFRDPASNMAFEMHQYLDANSSGNSVECVAPDRAAARLDDATRWLREHHARGFLAEFGAGPSPACLTALDTMLDAIDRASDVWLGWTYWAGGARWGNYPFSIQPTPGKAKPQMAVLRRHMPPSAK